MNATVILVRHAMPAVMHGTSSKAWGLSDASREDCVLLAHSLPEGVAGIWSSDERKAKETADVLGLRLGLPVTVEPRFQELDRPQVWDRDYREVAAAHLGGADEPGWESCESVVSRFSAAMSEVTRAAVGRGPFVVVSHGMAMSLWAASVARVDLVPWWRELTFPDAWRVDPEQGTLERIWMGGTHED